MLESFTNWKASSWIAPAVVFSLALFLFSINLDRPPHPDELHHALAAQHLLETGVPSIAEGEYRRGMLHTWLVAISYEIFGEELASARIPPVLIMALVASVLFVWVRREAGELAAVISAALFILSPFTVEIAQFSRFYALQILYFLFGSICAFYSLAAEISVARRVVLSGLAAALLALAYMQQVTTLFGIVGVAGWTTGVVVQKALFDTSANNAWKKVLAVSVVAAALLVVILATQTEILDWVLRSYRRASLFNIHLRNEFWFYFVRFFLFYPTLWSLIGLLTVFAVVQSPRLAWFVIAIFGISFLLISFAGSKAMRYFSFALPFLAVIWGVGLAYCFVPLSRFLEATRVELVSSLSLPERLGKRVATALLVIALTLIVIVNPFWLRTATVIGDVALPYDKPVTDWAAAREALAPWVTGADIMITTEELGAIYYLGRSDVRFSPSKIRELAPDQRKEFGIDYRTGRPIITKPESLERLIECFSRGIVVGPIEHWGEPTLIYDAEQAVIMRYARPVEVPEESHLYAWGWEREPRENKEEYCAELEPFSGR